MKVKVIKPFRDKHTGDFYEEGAVLDVTKVRGEELLKDKRELVVRVEKAKKKEV